MGPDDSHVQDQDALEELSAGLTHAEDQLNDHLPDGYYCKIEE